MKGCRGFMKMSENKEKEGESANNKVKTEHFVSNGLYVHTL